MRICFPGSTSVAANRPSALPGGSLLARAAWVCAAGVLSAALSACATTKAAAIVEGPPLAVSPPPPRVIVPFEEEPLAAVGNGLDTPLLASPRVQPSPMPRSRTVPARAETEPRSETPGAPAATVVGPSLSEPPRELQPVPSVAASPVNQQTVQGVIDRANLLLRGIDANRLNNDGKTSLEEARKFVSKSTQFLKDRNFQAAATAADKALTLAQSLTGR